ncbi:MAG: FadR family transcriptional regulator [Anaerolineae bacterium]|nr:FadR family transcriptional regulator [Anaerolineae bacterium]
MATHPFSAIEKNSLSEKIAAQVLSLIKDRHLKPGEKLPPERELAAMLQVSRASLREAFRALAAVGAIESRQGAGTYVTTNDPELVTDQLDYIISLNESTFDNLFEARRVLDTGIIAYAALRITDEELERLEEYTRLTDFEDYSAFLLADLEFHELIVRSARNPIFVSPYLASIRRLGRISRITSTPIPGLMERSLADHQAILDALRAHDPEAARVAMSKHLDSVEAMLHSVAEKETLLAPSRQPNRKP